MYEKATMQVSELKRKAEQVADYQEAMETLFEAQLADIPEEMRSLVPSKDEMSIRQRIAWIAKNKKLLLKPVAPNIGAGQRGTSTSGASVPGRELTADEKSVAKAFDYTEDEYKKFLGTD